jgi:multiple sugar transport system ATP-binding protein
VRGGLSLALARPLSGQAGRQVKLGIRAEDADTRQMSQMLSGRVSSVLPVGSDTFLGVDVEGATLFFRLGRELRAQQGENVSLAVNMSHAQLFDSSSGTSLLWQ